METACHGLPKSRPPFHSRRNLLPDHFYGSGFQRVLHSDFVLETFWERELTRVASGSMSYRPNSYPESHFSRTLRSMTCLIFLRQHIGSSSLSPAGLNQLSYFKPGLRNPNSEFDSRRAHHF